MRKEHPDDIHQSIEGCPFPQWVFIQDPRHDIWTAEEMAVAEAPIRADIQRCYDQRGRYADNTWTLYKYTYPTIGDTFTARKDSWESGSISGVTVEELAQKLTDYFQFK